MEDAMQNTPPRKRLRASHAVRNLRPLNLVYMKKKAD